MRAKIGSAGDATAIASNAAVAGATAASLRISRLLIRPRGSSRLADVVALRNRFRMYGLEPRGVAGLFAAGLTENGERALPNPAPEIVRDYLCFLICV